MRRRINFKLVFGLLGSLLIAAVGVHFLHGYQLGRNAYRLLERGERAREAEDYDKAQILYAQYLAFVPHDADAVQKYAQVLDRIASPGAERVRLVVLMEQVLRVKANEHEFRFRLVHNLIAHDRISDALDHLRRLDGHWDKAELLHMIGWCQDAQQKYAEAIASYEEAIRANPRQIKTYPLLVEIFQDRVGNPDEAQRVIDDLVRANTESHAAYLARAKFHRRRGDETAAHRDLERAHQLGRDRPEVILEVADAARTRGDWKQAIKLLEDGVKDSTAPGRATLQIALADAWVHLGDWDRAEGLLRDVARGSSKDLVSRAWLFELALQRNQIARARLGLDEIRAIEGEQGPLASYAEAAILVHEARGRSSKLDEARKKLQELGAAQKQWPRVVVLSATISELDGNHEQAIKEYTRALELGVTQPRVLGSLVGLLMRRGEFHKAEAHLAQYERTLPLTKDLARIGAEVALTLREKPYGKIALRRALQAVSLPTRDYREAIWLAKFYRAADQAGEAESLLRANLDQAGHVPDVWIAWMEFLVAANRREEALRDLERLKKEVATPRWPLTLARALEVLQLADQAGQAYQDALRTAPEDFTVIAYAADYFRRADRHEDAQRWYERLCDPALAAPAETSAQARRHLAVLLGTRGATARAFALLDDNKKDHGDTSADERIRLFLQSLTPANRSSAILQFQDSRRTQLLTADERLLLAHMLESADRLADARGQLAELTSEYPHEPRLLVRSAHLLIRLEELDEAQRLVTRLEAMEPNSRRVNEVRLALARARPQ